MERSCICLLTEPVLYSDPTDKLLMIIVISTHFFAVETTLAEQQFFRALAKLIGWRAAPLSACGIAAAIAISICMQEKPFPFLKASLSNRGI